MSESAITYIRQWITDDARFVLDFQVKSFGTTKLPEIYVSLTYVEARTSNKKKLWNEVYLGINADEQFVLNEKIDTYNLKGSLKATIDEQFGGNYFVVWGDFYFGNKKPFFHFIGPLLVEPINTKKPPKPRPPSPKPIKPSILSDNAESSNIIPIVKPDSYQDLFPFIYLNFWPDVDTEHRKLSFSEYKPIVLSPPTCQFYDNLILLCKTKDRAKVEHESSVFIEENKPYEGVFVNKVEELPGFLPSFILFKRQLDELVGYENIVPLTIGYFKTTIDDFYHFLKSRDYLTAKDRIWQSYFALNIRLGYRFDLLDQLTILLVCCNLLENVFLNLGQNPEKPPLTEAQMRELLRASIILPESIFPLPPYQFSPPIASDNSWVEPYAIGNLQIVKQKLLRYEAGEISNVISIMPGERKENVKRNLKQETQNVNEIEINENHSSRFEKEVSDDLNSEVMKTLMHSQENNTYQDFNTSYGPPTSVKLDGSFKIERNSVDPSKENSISYAKKILNTATNNILKKVSRSRDFRIHNESEETSASIFDNTGNDTAVYGAFCWLNKVYEAQMYNYGNRLMISFLITEPANQYIKSELNLRNEKLLEPISPENKFGIKTFNDIDSDNYLEICSFYDIESSDLPPEAVKTISLTLEGVESKMIEVPEGYQADKAFLIFIASVSNNIDFIKAMVGRNSVDLSNENTIVGPIPMSGENVSIPVSVSCEKEIQSPPLAFGSFKINIEIECVYSERKLKEWKQKIYILIRNAFKEQKKNYYNELNADLSKDVNSNPTYSRSIIRKELRKLCIKKLIDNMISIKGLYINHDKDSPTVYEVNKPRFLQFLNNAIEWGEMSYSLLEDYGAKIDYSFMSDIEPGNELVFNAFLQAEAARIIIPIRPEFNHTILYFMETGLVWMGKDELAPLLLKQSSLISELKRVFALKSIDEKLLNQWEFTVPTSLQILRNDNVENIDEINTENNE